MRCSPQTPPWSLANDRTASTALAGSTQSQIPHILETMANLDSLLLDEFRSASVTEREKGTYFEELIICYLRNEATYRDLYSDVWTYATWAEKQGLDCRGDVPEACRAQPAWLATKEMDVLTSFYESVKQRAEGIENASGKQKIVIELYDRFFRNAFPRMTERLGILYTPIEVVDFIIKSVDHILQTEFSQTLGSKGVHILDPFTGTGTFITRLLQSGLLTSDELRFKYRQEIHANEIVLLAYYIAAINIEAVYHSLMGGKYEMFEGICLTDTFQLYEKEDLLSTLLVDNSARRKRQKNLDIRVIMGNPPYSVGQASANDNNQNVSYPHLDNRIAQTYAARSHMTSVNKLYDSYIRAIRWASDRVGNHGVIGFVTNAGYLDSASADGLRQSISEEFSSVFVFHLRGNQRTSGEASRREGGKIFGSGSRAPIAISFFMKNQAAPGPCKIHFYDMVTT